MIEPLGLILVVALVPMILRWVPQNPVDGFRIRGTCKDQSGSYDANALSGGLCSAWALCFPSGLRFDGQPILQGRGTHEIWRPSAVS